MRKKARLAFVVLLTVLWAAVVYAELNLQEGKWEITSEVEMKGMPTDMPPVKTTRCLSNKDAVPQKPGKNQDCKTISKKVEGNTVTWFIQCSDKEGNTIDSRGSITYTGASFDGLANNMIGKLLSQEGLGKHPEAFFLYRQTVV